MTRATTTRLSWPRGPIREAFTLPELLVVIAIITILASSVLFAMWGAVEQARISRTQTQIAKLNDLIKRRWDSYVARSVRVNTSGLPFLSEPFSDLNNNGIWDTGEPYEDKNNDTVYTLGGNCISRQRVNALRELIRLEMPDRILDVENVDLDIDVPTTAQRLMITPTTLTTVPTLNVRYYARSLQSKWANKGNRSYQGAECLYMIIESIQDEEVNGLAFLHEGEIGDVDEDGMPEILDAWGNPIEFLRWAPGFIYGPGEDGKWGVASADDDGNGVTDDYYEAHWATVNGGTDDIRSVTEIMSVDPNDWLNPSGGRNSPPDPLDPMKVYPNAFAIFPLIFSAGPDGLYDIVTNVKIGSPAKDFNYSTLSTVPNDPYFVPPNTQFPLGVPMDANGDGLLSYDDNITNHYIEMR